MLIQYSSIWSHLSLSNWASAWANHTCGYEVQKVSGKHPLRNVVVVVHASGLGCKRFTLEITQATIMEVKRSDGF